MKTAKAMVMLVVLGMVAVGVQADEFTTANPSGTAHNFSIDFVTVGDAGNAGVAGWQNTTEVRGGVAYEYRVGKTEISVGQYNAMEYAITGNAAGLNSTMAAGGANTLKAMMYANWLNAGCPSGGLGLTDGGAYNMTWTSIQPWSEDQQWDNGDGTKNIWRHKDAKYFLLTEDELVKAAFYKGGSTNAGYWQYPTSSDVAPAAEGASAGTNSANFNNVVGSALDVGSYPNTQSPCGALDMAGNLWELAEVRYAGATTDQYMPGWMDGYIHGDAWLRGTIGFGVNTAYDDLGFRVGSVVPEPATLSLLAVAAVGLLRRKK